MAKKRFIISVLYMAITLLIASLTACEDYHGTTEIPDGPVLKYQVKGIIVDEQGHQIAGLKVSLKEGPYYYGKIFVGRDSVYTDHEGAFVTDVMADVAISSFQKLIIEDRKGHFLSDTISLDKLERIQIEKEGGSRWGTYLLSANRVLKRRPH